MTPAEVLAQMAEEATPELLRVALEMFFECDYRNEEKERCGKPKKAHPQKGHVAWVPAYGAVDAIRLIEMTTKLSRHEGKADREFGLDKRVEPERVPWLVGIDVSEWKRMSAEEQDRKLLEVIDAEVVEREGGVEGVVDGRAEVACGLCSGDVNVPHAPGCASLSASEPA